MSSTQHEWPLWEVFIRSRQGLGHKHAGSLHATDAEMAIQHARDVYTRRQEGVSICRARRSHHGIESRRQRRHVDPANDKVYRHPTFYKLPDEVNNM